jgi:hypothetical protein
MFSRWLKRFLGDRALIEKDAADFIARFGDGAYMQALDREEGIKPRGEGRTADHWRRVAYAIMRIHWDEPIEPLRPEPLSEDDPASAEVEEDSLWPRPGDSAPPQIGPRGRRPVRHAHRRKPMRYRVG